jgi:probable rRNA maturation factor
MIRFEMNQSILKGGQRLPHKVVERALRVVQKGLGTDAKTEVSIAFVTKKQMRALNKQYRGKDCLTDVLSFELDEPGLLGELILSYDQAKVQAKQMRHSTRTELVFLIVHGMLHLYGYDHEVKKDAKQMFRLQTKMLKTLGINPIL